MFTVQFWKDTAERAVKTGAQSAVLVLGGNVADVFSVDWQTVVGFGVGGMVLSLFTSLASGALPMGSPGTASLTKAVEPAPDQA